MRSATPNASIGHKTALGAERHKARSQATGNEPCLFVQHWREAGSALEQDWNNTFARNLQGGGACSKKSPDRSACSGNGAGKIMKVLLIAGGWSSEREVSLAAVPGLTRALEELGHTVTFFDLKKDFDGLLAQAQVHDFAFINLHGAPGEDGLVQAMLDSVGCPYQGAGPAGSFLALNKACAKQIFRAQGIPTSDWDFLPDRPDSSWQPSFPYPVFVKSCTGGSSLRMGRASSRAELDSVLDDIFAHGEGALVEPALPGHDVTCAVLGSTPLPPILILPQKGDFFDFVSKYQDGGAQEICPAPIPDEVTRKLQEYTLKAARALGLGGWARGDFILGEDGSLNILEVNTLPGMTPASLVPKAAAAAGMSFADLIGRLIELGLARHAKQ